MSDDDRENGFEALLDKLLEKQGNGTQGRSHSRKNVRVSRRRRYRLGLCLIILTISGAAASLYIWQNGYLSFSTPHGLRAALVDGLSVEYADPWFVDNVTKTLVSAGYTVDYFGPEKFTVDMFANLPGGGYGLVIIRAHTAATSIITSEVYSASKYVYEQLIGAVSPATIGTQAEYFAVASQFISGQMHGRFQNAIIVLMGCGDPSDRLAVATAFADRGAATLIGWDNSVSASHTDTTTSVLLSALARGKTVQEAVSIASSPDPVYHGRLGFVQSSDISQTRLNSLLRQLSVFLAFGVLLVFGPLIAFLVPKFLARR